MSPVEIKIEFLKRNIRMADIARELNITQTAVQRVIERDSVSERVMVSIAEAICVPRYLVFPEHEFKSQPELICRN